MNSQTSIWESCYQHHEDTARSQNAGAAASAASSPGRRASTSPPAQTPWDNFTHEGKTYRILRMLPGTYPGEQIQPHQPVLATIHALEGTVTISARATTRTPHLVHVIWKDELGETYGTWLPKKSVQPDNLPPESINPGV